MNQTEINRMLSEDWVAITLVEAQKRQNKSKYMLLWRPNPSLSEEDQYCLCKEVM